MVPPTPTGQPANVSLAMSGEDLQVDPARRIEERLAQTRFQVRLVDLLTELTFLAVVTAAYLILGIATDHWIFRGGLGFSGRAFWFLGLVTLWALIVGIRVMPLLIYRINPLYAAKTLEEHAPRLKDSLINWFLLRRDHPRGPVQQRVLDGLGQSTAAQLDGVSVEAAVDRSHLIRLATVLLALVAILCFYTVLSPKSSVASAARILLPWAGISRPTRVTVDAVRPGDVTAFEGDRIDISAEARGLRPDETVYYHFTTDDRRSTDEAVPMEKPPGDYRWHGTLPPGTEGLRQSLTYYVAAGDGRSDTFRITVRPPPTITVQEIEYDFPSYTGRPNEVVRHSGDIRGLEGTVVTIRATANVPIDRATLELDGNARLAHRMTVDGRNATTQLTLQLSEQDPTKPWHESYQIRFTDKDGNPNRSPIRHTIEVLPDLAPEIDWLDTPPPMVRLPLDGRLELGVRARDPDFGLRSVKIHMQSGDAELAIDPLLDRPYEGLFEGRLTFSPREHRLRAGDQVVYWAEAIDVKLPDPNVATTDRLWITIEPPEQRGDDGAAQDGQQADPRQGERPDDRGEQPRERQPGGEQQPQPGDPTAEAGEGGEGEGDPTASGGEGDPSDPQDAQDAQGTAETNPDADPRDASGETSPDGGDASAEGQPGQEGSAGGDGASESDVPPESGAPPQPGTEGDQTGARDPDQSPPGEASSEPSAAGADENETSPGTAGSDTSDPRTGASSSGEADQQTGNGGTSGQGDASGATGQTGGSQPGSDSQSEPADQGAGQDGGDPSAGRDSGGSERSDESRSDAGEGVGNATDGNRNGRNGNNREQPRGGRARGPIDGQSNPGDVFDTVLDRMKEKGEFSDTPDAPPSPSTDAAGDPRSDDVADGHPTADAPPGTDPRDAVDGGQADPSERPNAYETTSADPSTRAERPTDPLENVQRHEGHGQRTTDEAIDAHATGPRGSETPGEGRDPTRDAPHGAQDTVETGDEQTTRPGNALGSESTEQPSETSVGEGAPRDQQPGRPGEPGDASDGARASPDTESGSFGPSQGGDGPQGQRDGEARQPTALGGDVANREYAERAVDLALRHLEEQLERGEPDAELLDRLGWTPDQMRQFVDQWRKMQRGAPRPDAEPGQPSFDEAVRGLGLRPRATQIQGGGGATDRVRSFESDDLRPPASLMERFRAYTRGTASGG